MAKRGLRKGSLSGSGAAAALAVGLLGFATHFSFGFTLILFYFTSSQLTKYKGVEKSKLEDGYKLGGQRHAGQVLACSVFATIAGMGHLAISLGLLKGDVYGSAAERALAAAVLGHYACCAGDTWASELGVLGGTPRLITTLLLRACPPGTNGGMSLLGTAASAAGGLAMGIGFAAADQLGTATGFGPPSQLSAMECVVLGLSMGFLGSIVDSLLGATLQATYYDTDRKCIVPPEKGSQKGVVHVCGMDLLSNEAVNLWSVLLTTIFSGAAYAAYDA